MLEVLKEHIIIQSDRHCAIPRRGPNWCFFFFFLTASQSPIYYCEMKYSCLMTHLGHTVSTSLVGGY